MLVLAAVFALAIGLSLGLLGGGGAILTTPILVYVLRIDAKEAIATSLLVVGATSAAGVAAHARAGNVVWRTGLLFGVAGMVGAYGGGNVAGLLRGKTLLVAFAAMMLVTAVAMIRRRRVEEGDGHMHAWRAVLAGVAVGAAAGLVGAGGGFLVVPALTLFGGVPMRRAIGTSLFVIALQSFAGFAGHAGHTHVDLALVLAITTSAVVGSLAGARLAARVSPEALRKAFAWFVLAMGVFVLVRELPLVYAAAAAPVAIAAALLSRRPPATSRAT